MPEMIVNSSLPFRTHVPYRCARAVGRLPVTADVLHNNAANLGMT
jgi:hypothetical protein